jgi:hypothetical protein
MRKLQSLPGTGFTTKASLGLLVAVVAAGALAVAVAAGTTRSSHSRALHVTKECSQYTGAAGSFCTIEHANVKAIAKGARVIYTSAAGAASLDSDVVLDSGHGNKAYGHVTLDFATMTGVVAFSGGTGRLSGFEASAEITYNAKKDLWHWDGTYSLPPHGHGD